MQPENIRAGVYQHYKGPMYLVLGVAHDSNADTLHSGPPHMHCKPLEERFVVVYVALNNDKSGPPMAVRTVEDFFAKVCTKVEHRHYGGPPDDERVCEVAQRFTYIGTDRPGL